MNFKTQKAKIISFFNLITTMTTLTSKIRKRLNNLAPSKRITKKNQIRYNQIIIPTFKGIFSYKKESNN